MLNINPLLLVGGVIGAVTALLIFAYASVKDKKTAMGFERTMADGEILRRLFAYAKPYWAKFLLVLFLMLFSIAYDIISPLIVGAIEELVAADFALSRLFASVAVYAGVLVFSMASTYFQAVILQRVGQRIISDLREDLFTHIESLSHEQLNEIPVGKLVTRVTNDTNAISMMFTNLLVNLIKNAFVILGILVAMLCLNYALTLMVLCFVPFIVIFTVIFRKFSRRAYRKVKDATTDINTYLSENLSGIKVTQIFGREDEKMAEFYQKSQTLSKVTQEQIFVFGVFRPLVYMLYISSILCLFYLGGMGHLNNVSFLGQTITGGTIVTFYMYISKFFTPIQNLAEQFNWLQSALASSEKVFSIMDIQPKLVDAPDAIELTDVKGEIEFRDVWFSYIPGEWVLQGVSFHVSPRETVAFVGSTGSGKSTILSLICRNYEFQKGEILIDGIDIRKIKISSLRRHFGQMLQDVFLFSGTIRSNIVLREDNISDEEIMQVCRYVNADHFINKLDHGLDEEVRERGNNFSAGQRQLLSFARTIIHKPSVMILDEATANIDTETELLIQDSLEKMRTVGTMLIVAHRLSTIQHADNIIVLSHGKILEQGSHQELLELLHSRGHFVLLYLGGFSAANALEDLVFAAALAPPGIAFVLMGDGPYKNELRSRAKKLRLDNLYFLDPAPKGEATALLPMADALYLGAKRSPLYQYGVGMNKLFDYLLSGRPILYGVAGAGNLVERSGCGLTLPPEDPRAIVEGAKALLALSPEERAELGKRGKDYVRDHHRYDRLAKEYIDYLTGL